MEFDGADHRGQAAEAGLSVAGDGSRPSPAPAGALSSPPAHMAPSAPAGAPPSGLSWGASVFCANSAAAAGMVA
jgi:hypothetical protein